jgi:UDP-N-acetylmuramate dehydrogenase
MKIQENVDLSNYSTMGLGGKASFLTHVSSKEELIEAVNFANSEDLPIITIGSGSNIFWKDEGYDGLIIVSDIKGIAVDWQSDNDATVNIGSGEVWDEVVEKCVSEGLTGIEALSLIPGKAGATPVQNVGAYGQEIANSLINVEAYDSVNKEFVTMKNEDCGFGYRTSRFKTSDHGRFFIISINLHLTKANPKPPFYAALTRYLEEHNITEYTPEVIRAAVIDIRSHKLPDPKLVHNNGSFFANPVVTNEKHAQLIVAYPELPSWPAEPGKVKLPAAWLIEQAGFKDYYDDETGMATWAAQPLVLVNKHAKSTNDLLNFRNKIVEAVKEKFGVQLTQEPELLP